MDSIRRYENYPAWIVILSNMNSLMIYVLGFVILNQIGWIAAGLYLIYILFFEYRLIKYHCVNCFYFGKTCGFGKGRLSSLFFKKGVAAKFCIKDLSWKEMIPDLLLSLIPFVTGIILLIVDFNLILLAALLLLLLLTTVGNGIIRGKLACNHCRQKELGCLADVLFNKGK